MRASPRPSKRRSRRRAGATRPALGAGGRRRARDEQLAQGRPAGDPAQRQPRGDRPVDQGTGHARAPAARRGARPDRARPAAPPGGGAHGRPRWTAPETRPCYDRARELCARIGDTEGLFPVLYGQFSHHLSRGEADAAHGLALQTLQLTEAAATPALRSMAHSMLGMSLFSRGELATALSHLRAALSLVSRRQSFAHVSVARPQLRHRFAVARLDTSSSRLSGAGVAARRCGARAARALSNPHTLAHALALACRYHSVLGAIAPLRLATEELAALAAEHRFPFYAAAAQIYRGWVLSAGPTSPAESKCCGRAWRPSWISAPCHFDLIFRPG